MKLGMGTRFGRRVSAVGVGLMVCAATLVVAATPAHACDSQNHWLRIGGVGSFQPGLPDHFLGVVELSKFSVSTDPEEVIVNTMWASRYLPTGDNWVEFGITSGKIFVNGVLRNSDRDWYVARRVARSTQVFYQEFLPVSYQAKPRHGIRGNDEIRPSELDAFPRKQRDPNSLDAGHRLHRRCPGWRRDHAWQ